MKKRYIALVVIVLLVVIVAFVGLHYFQKLDKIVEAAIEEYGSEMTQANVTVDSVKLDFAQGEASINGLFIGNPAGYETSHLFRLEQIKVKLDLESISSDTIKVSEILIQQPDIIYELAGGGSNLNAIQENINQYTGAEEAKQEENESGPKLIIENLYIKDGSVNVSHSSLKGKTLSAPLPNIHLRDIGKDKGGAKPAEVAKKIIDSIKSGAQTAATSLNLGGLVDGIKDKVTGAGGAVKEGLDGAGDKLKSLFK